MQKKITQRDDVIGYVGDVAIVEKAPAMHETPLTRGKRVPLVGGEELLLADGTVVYRCAKPVATAMDPTAQGICHRIFDTVGSLRAHIAYHARKKREREAAHEIAQKRASQEIVARATWLLDQFDIFKNELELLGKSADELVTELRELVRLLPESVADEDTLAAARKYEEMRKAAAQKLEELRKHFR